MNVQFENYWLLYFLWLVPLVALWWHVAKSKRERKLESFMSQSMQVKLNPPAPTRRFSIQLVLLACGIFLLLIALARPQWGTKTYKVHTRGRDLIIALDVSRSMLANDTHPNRLQRAKTDIMDLIRELKGDRAALLVFRHKAILRCPLTTDYAFLQQSLDAVTIDSAPKGETDIGDAIFKALDAFDNENGSNKAIILISDGEDLSGRAMDAAAKAGELNIPIFTVGLGSKSGSTIPESGGRSAFVKFKGENVVTKLNHESLYNLAKKSGGAYIHAATANMDLGTLYNNHLKSVSAQDMQETQQTIHVERFQLFLLPALALMIAACFFSLGRLAACRRHTADHTHNQSGFINRSSLKSGVNALIIALLVCCPHKAILAQTNEIPDSAAKISAPAGREGARKAQRLYKKGMFKEASDVYLEAARTSTENAQRDFRYNAAISLYQAGEYKEAADILRSESLSNSGNTSLSANALGTALYKAADSEESSKTNIVETARLLKQAGEAFKSAARSDQSNSKAKRNLAVVVNRLPEVQQQAHLSELMAKYGDSQPAELLLEMLNNQREITKGIPTIMTNDSPSQITQFEDYSRLQKDTSDIWIPLKKQMLSSISQLQNTSTNLNQQQIQQLAENMDAIQGAMRLSAEQLRDLDAEGFQSAQASQAGVYRLWKSVAPYQQLLSEDINLQSNLLDVTQSLPLNQETEAMQNEGADLTKLFSERFQAAVPESQQTGPEQPKTQGQQQSISPEDRQKIIDYADMAMTAQKLASKHIETKNREMAVQEERKAYDLLKEIEKLLPKDQNQQQDQQQDQDQQQQEQQNQDENKQEQQENQNQDQQQQEDQTEQQMKPEDSTPEEIRDLLEKALEREKEHEAEKQRRQNQIPMSPRERDW